MPMAQQDLQIDWLRAFVAVVDAGSLTAAAPLVHRSQSALSMQLKKLEDAAGTQLLARGPRHLALTPSGAELLRHARRLLALHEDTLAALHGPAVSGRLSLGVPDDYAVPHLTPVLRSFASRHAAVEILLVCEQSTALIPKVGRGELDLAVVTRDRPQRGELLFREPLVWVGSAAHEAWRRDPLPVAVYESGSKARQAALAALAQQRRAHRIVCNSSSLAGHVAAVEGGLAVAVLTRCSVPPGLQILDARHKLPPLATMEVAVIRRKGAPAAAIAMHEQIVRTLRQPA
jgi:DNA-binding transcriptional LysR family regulator